MVLHFRGSWVSVRIIVITLTAVASLIIAHTDGHSRLSSKNNSHWAKSIWNPKNAKPTVVHKLFDHYMIIIYVLNTFFEPKLINEMLRFRGSIFVIGPRGVPGAVFLLIIKN